MDAKTIALAAQLLVAESAAETRSDRPTADAICDAMRSELDAKLQAAWDDPSQMQAHLTGRRRGKTEYFARRALRGALQFPRSINPYILPTAKSARLIAWPVLRRVVQRHAPFAKILDHEMTVVVPDAGTIVVGGCEVRNDVGRWYGMPFGEAIVDECGTFPDFLGELIAEALEPGTMDFPGSRISLGGNPGARLTGWWFDLTNDARRSDVPLYLGDARDNPHLPHAADFLQRTLRRNGWTWDTPTFVRMYLGRWAEDAGELVYPFDPQRNGAAGLPERNYAGVPLDPEMWRYVIGVDVGVVHSTAIVVVAAHPDCLDDFVVHSEKHQGWIADNLAERLRELRGDPSVGLKGPYPSALVVLDAGGMGKEHSLVLTRRYGIHHEATKKTDKESHVREWRDRLIAGRLKVLDGQANDALRDEMAVLGWDADRRLPSKLQPDDACDAMIYALRALGHYVRGESELAPELGTPEWERAEVARMRADRIAKHGGQRDRRTLPWAS